MQEYFFFRIDGKYVKIYFHEIIYIEGCRNYLKIISDKKSYLVLMTMKRMLEILPDVFFQRIHKSYIISLNKVAAFDKDTVRLCDKELPIGHRFRYILENIFTIATEDSVKFVDKKPLITMMAISGRNKHLGLSGAV